MLRLLMALVSALRSAFRSRRELLLENIALRQQLATMVQSGRPRIGPVDRAFWIALRRVWSRWADILVIVKPETVVGWHRAGFKLYWRWLSRKGKRSGRQPLAREVRDLIRRMASENGWGAPRIHGELLKLGFRVSERTVSRYMRQPGRWPERRQNWLTFLLDR
jgi:putative transposase